MSEIISAFKQLALGNPVDFYDAIITAGQALRKGQTLLCRAKSENIAVVLKHKRRLGRKESEYYTKT